MSEIPITYKELADKLTAEEAKNLRLCQTIAKQKKEIDRLNDNLAGAEAAADSLYQDNMSMLGQ